MAFERRDEFPWPAGVWFAEEADSTNAEVLRRPSAELASGSVFWAAHQTAGRGRFGRSWEDPPGKALTISLAFPKLAEIEPIHWLHLAAGCVIAELAESLHGGSDQERAHRRLGVKWPNDVVELAPETGAGFRKLAGILTEVQTEPGSGETHRAALGIGLNVNQQPQDFAPEFRERATSLAILTGETFELREVLLRLLEGLGRRQAQIEQGELEAVQGELARRDLLAGHWLEVGLPNGKTLEGRAEGLDKQARLQLRTANEERYHLESGEVTRLRPRWK